MLQYINGKTFVLESSPEINCMKSITYQEQSILTDLGGGRNWWNGRNAQTF